MAKPKMSKRSRVESESRGPSDDGSMPPVETAPPRRCSEARRKKGKMIQSRLNRTDEMTSQICSHGEVIQTLLNHTTKIQELLEKRAESDNNQSIQLGKIVENQSCQRKHLKKVTRSLKKVTERLEKLSEGQNDICKQLELHTNAPRSQWSKEQTPTYRLEFKSSMEENIDKGKSIQMHVALVDSNSGQIVKDGPLASATVELVVIDAKFNQNNNEHNWSIEDFRSKIRNERQGKSLVSKGQFNLEKGEKLHCGFSIIQNSTNSRFRLGVMLVSKTQERVLEGLSNPFFVRGHDRNRKKPQVANGNQAQNGQISNMQNPSCRNSTQADGNGPVTPVVLGYPVPGYQALSQGNTVVLPTEPNTSQQLGVPTMAEDWNTQFGLDIVEQSWLLPVQNIVTPCIGPYPMQQALIPHKHSSHRQLFTQSMKKQTGTQINMDQTTFLQSVWDIPNVEPSKRLDALVSLSSSQPKFNNYGLSTMGVTAEHYSSLMTIVQKQEIQTRRKRGVLIEPLEPDNSYEERPLKRKVQSKYCLRFINKVCKEYYILDKIKADDSNLLTVALFDDKNTKITSGPLSSASVEVVALHGDFNADGLDYWTSEEFRCSIVYPQDEEESFSVLEGDRSFVLVDGEACLSDAFFKKTSFGARTGKFKLGVMVASAQVERVQEGISEPFEVMDRRLKSTSEPLRVMDQTVFPVRLVWDMPSYVEATKGHWNLHDQLMPWYNCQPKSNKYQLRFVNEVCEAYYTMDKIKADDGSLLKVALFDENNMKIKFGPLCSATIEIVVLHGDFNKENHQDYWTSEDLSRSVVCPQPRQEASSVLGGDRILVLADGEACLGDAFFQKPSFCARTRKFKLGAVLLDCAQQVRIQEGITEPFLVMDRPLAVFRKDARRPNPKVGLIRSPKIHAVAIQKRRRSRLADNAKRIISFSAAFFMVHGVGKREKILERVQYRGGVVRLSTAVSMLKKKPYVPATLMPSTIAVSTM